MEQKEVRDEHKVLKTIATAGGVIGVIGLGVYGLYKWASNPEHDNLPQELIDELLKN